MTKRFPGGVFSDGTDPDARFTLANERTFLAWTRTALALLAGGVAIHAPVIELDGWAKNIMSVWLLAAAALALVLGWQRWRASERAMRNREPLPGFGGPTALAVLLGALVFVAVVGVIVMALG